MGDDSGFWATDDLSDIFGAADAEEEEPAIQSQAKPQAPAAPSKPDSQEARSSANGAASTTSASASGSSNDGPDAALRAKLEALENQVKMLRGQLGQEAGATPTAGGDGRNLAAASGARVPRTQAAQQPAMGAAGAHQTQPQKPLAGKRTPVPAQSKVAEAHLPSPAGRSSAKRDNTKGAAGSRLASIIGKGSGASHDASSRNSRSSTGTSTSTRTSGAAKHDGKGPGIGGVRRAGAPAPKTTANSAKQSSGSTPASASGDKEEYTGLHVKNRAIGSLHLRTLMEGKRFVPIGDVVRAVRRRASGDDSASESIVTLAVVARKTTTKQTKHGSNYSVWTLSDLKDGQAPLFVSGGVHAKHWREAQGVLVGVCNPTLMDARDDTSAMLTVRDATQIIIIGVCADFGICRGVKKDGAPCSLPVNLQLGEYCKMHVATEYWKKKKMKNRQQHHVLKMGNGPIPSSSDFLAARAAKRRASAGPSAMGAGSPLGSERPKQKRAKTPLEKMKNQVRLETVTNLSSNNTFRKVMRTMVSSNDLAKKMVQHEHKEAARRRDGSFLKKRATDVRPDNKAATSVLTPTCDKLLALNGQSRPMVARGAQEGTQIQLTHTKDQYARAVMLARSKGGFAKVNPNAPSSGNVDVSKVKQRLAEHEELVKDQQDPGRKKKSALLSIVGDVNSDESRKLLSKESRHLDEFHATQEKELMRTFARGEELEQMEEKMKSITETVVTCWKCSTCKRLTMATPKMCMEKGHAVNKVKAKKRFFTCNHCRKHMYTLGQRIPTKICPDCGRLNWRVASMLKERRGKGESRLVTHFGDHPRLHKS